MLRSISSSGNVALYPALCRWADDSLACTWYEYSSPVEPTPSDIWFSTSPDGAVWTRPVRVSDGVSYNGGASLLWQSADIFHVAWHSWRTPGREPFSSPRGGLANIWLARSLDEGRTWSPPIMAFPGIVGSKYASYAATSDGRMWMAFEEVSSRSVKISSSSDGLDWTTPVTVVEGGSNPDLFIDWDGRFHLVHAFQKGGRKGFRYLTGSDGKTWESPFRLPSLAEGRPLSRPKISLLDDGRLAVMTHTDGWGDRVNRYEIDLNEDKLELHIGVEWSAGNAFWTLNSLSVFSSEGERIQKILFGPIREGVGEEDWLVSAVSPLLGTTHPVGFDRPVMEMMRELGSPETKGLVYSDQTRRFELPLKPGRYFLEIVYSSWIASVPAVRFYLNAEILESVLPGVRPDRCCLIVVGKDGEPSENPFPRDDGHDHNRPSRLVRSGNGPEYWGAWTSFAGEGVRVVCGRFRETAGTFEVIE